MRQRIIRTGALIVVLVVALLFASAGAVQASARGAATQARSSMGCLQPPNNVDHATFTAEQLALYGLPPRAQGEPSSHWQEVVRAAKHRFCTGMPTDHFSHWHPGTILTSGTETNQNWAGYVAINWGYTETIGDWTVPCLTLLLKPGVSSVWVGLGGDGSDGGGPLIQTGTEQTEYQTWWGQWVAKYYAWYEDVPGQPQQYAFGVNCGDSITAYATSIGSPASMYLVDNTSNNYLYQTNNQLSNGSTSEWIVERDSVNGSLGGLADFHSATFSDSEAYQGGVVHYLNNLPYNTAYMYSNDWSKLLASPGGLGGNGAFTVTWKAYGP
jgi:hypothetical protein